MTDKLTHRNRQVFLIKWYIKLSLLINSIRSFGLFFKMSPCANLFICEGAWLNKYERAHKTHEWFCVKTPFDQVQRCQPKKIWIWKKASLTWSFKTSYIKLCKEDLCQFNPEVRVSNMQNTVPQNAKNQPKDRWKMYNLCTYIPFHLLSDTCAINDPAHDSHHLNVNNNNHTHSHTCLLLLLSSVSIFKKKRKRKSAYSENCLKYILVQRNSEIND